MKIVVLIAGVHDPKWPIDAAAALSAPGDRHIMSPFDEAALEMGLRLRDAAPATEIAVRIAGGEGATKIARTVLALNVGDVAVIAFERAWDQAATARALAPECEGADLVLLGREFGDFDDGLVPSTLAGLLGAGFFARAQAISFEDGPTLLRETGASEERVTLSAPLVASVTNDRRTRLRKPLMKNVMQCRAATIESRVVAASSPPSPLILEHIGPAAMLRATSAYTMLEGAIDEQVRALADTLWDARA